METRECDDQGRSAAAQQAKQIVLSVRDARSRLRRSTSEAVIARKHDGLRSRPDAEFVKDVGRVIADGLLADLHLNGDVGIAQPVGNQRQDLTFAYR